MLIGLIGRKQVGKSTVSRIWRLLDIYYNSKDLTPSISYKKWVKKKLNDDKYVDSYCLKSSFKEKQFAYKLKQIVCMLTGCTIGELVDMD